MKRRTMKRLWLLLAGCLLLALAGTAAAADPIRYEVSTAAELAEAALAVNAAGGEAEIVLKADITLSKDTWQAAQAAQAAAGLPAGDDALLFPQGTVTLLGEGHSITADAAGHRGISVSGSAVLNLGAPGYEQSLTIRGGGGDAVLLSPLVSVSGAAVLNVYDGAALRDTLSLSTPGGVQLAGTAELNMHGGVIENCNNSASAAGGVVVDGASVFRLSGGTIRGCTGYGGAVAIGGQGRMEFSAGLIENCESLDCGGAILLVPTAPIYYGGGTAGPVIPGLSMTGGTIRGCKAVTPSSSYVAGYGGGVALYAYDAAAELTGGVITGCSAVESGGGVACLFGKVTVDGCAVYDNTAAASADDVYNYGGGGTLTLGALPDGLTLTDTGKPIDGWYRDMKGTNRRWSYLFDNAPAAILPQGALTASTREHTIKAAHGAYYTVTYDLGGGTGAGYDPVSVAKGARHTLLPAPARDGHVFTGWKVGSTVRRPGEAITVNAAVTARARWLTVDEWIGQRLNIRVDVDVSVAIGTDQQQEISADVSEESRAWLRAQVEEWIRALLAQGAPPELDAEHAAMLLRLLSAGADSVDVTLTVGVRLTGDPDEGELALLSPHMDGSETAQVWQLTVELGAEAKMAGSAAAFDKVDRFPIHELDEPADIRLTTGQSYAGLTVRVLYIHSGAVREAASWVDAGAGAVIILAREFSPYVILSKPASGGGGGGAPTHYALSYSTDGGTVYPDELHPAGSVVSLEKMPVRPGHIFTGWYAEPSLTTRLDSVHMTAARTVHAGWMAAPIPAWLDGEGHIAYVYGYRDGYVRPQRNITRAEVAAIFYRLLRPDVRAEYASEKSPFADVPDTAWCAAEIATLARMGIFNGKTADTFAPTAPITRAEFAAVCARFDRSGTQAAGAGFADIAGHWAQEQILRAAALGWVHGYSDGRFAPDEPITRAEAVMMINRVLRRDPAGADDLLAGMKRWPDNPESAWYYLAVQEATNGHEYRRADDGHEQWTALTGQQP